MRSLEPQNTRSSRRAAAREANRQQLEALVEELAANVDRPHGSGGQQRGDYFAACMNETAIDAAPVTPLAGLLAEIADVHEAAGVQRMIRRLHELAVPAPFVVTGASDYHDPASVVVNIACRRHGVARSRLLSERRATLRRGTREVSSARGQRPDARRRGRRAGSEGWADVAACRRFGVEADRKRIGQRTSRAIWQLPPSSPDAYIDVQQFFIAWGQFRGAAESLELRRQMVRADPHPTAQYRVIGPLWNAPEFQHAFACKAGSAMVRAAEQRCVVW